MITINTQLINGKYQLKIPSKLHKNFNYELQPQIKLEVRGKVDFCFKTAKIKLKTEQIRIIAAPSSPQPLEWESLLTKTCEPKNPEDQNSETQSKILICQKSTCWKQGGEAIYERLTEEIKQKGLQEQVIIKKTGCMGRCKHAPNVVTLPDRTRYQCFNLQEVDQLIEKHCNS